eukprot:COSAG02_NODE_3231_length_7137_cov_32.345411_4_plen_109_part_00
MYRMPSVTMGIRALCPLSTIVNEIVIVIVFFCMDGHKPQPDCNRGIHVSRVSHVWVPTVTDFLLGDGQLASPARPTPAPSTLIRSDSAFPHALGRGGVCGPGIYVPAY